MRTIFSMLLAVFLCFAAFAQSNRLDYYQHIKTVRSNGYVENQSGQSGQFVNRTQIGSIHVCYDATSIGLEHLNGRLSFTGYNNGTEVYEGTSYWGPAKYQFDDNRGYLNVKDKNGNVFVFRKATAPAGKRSSSYLVKGAAVNGYDAVTEWNKIHNPGQYDDYNNKTSTAGKAGNKRTTTRKSSSSKTCSHCNGYGRIRVHVGTGGYGVSNKKAKCPTCGETYFTANDHWHDCPYCK